MGALLDTQRQVMVTSTQDNDKKEYMPVKQLILDTQQTRDLLQRVAYDASSVVIQKDIDVAVVY